MALKNKQNGCKWLAPSRTLSVLCNLPKELKYTVQPFDELSIFISNGFFLYTFIDFGIYEPTKLGAHWREQFA